MKLLSRDDVSSTVLPKKLVGCLVIGYRRLSCRLEIPDKNNLPVDLYFRAVPFGPSGFRPQDNTPKSGLVIASRSLISLVLSARYLPKVLFSAIKPISAYVVNVFLGESEDKSVEVNKFFSLTTALRDVCHSVFSASLFMKTPLESANNVRVLVVDQCRLALREWNYNHSLSIPHFGGA